jgi:hypothetical protein
MFVHRHSDGKEQFDRVMAAVRAAPELVELGKDGSGETRFTSRAMLETEQRLERAAARLAERSGHGLPAAMSEGIHIAAGSSKLVLGGEQQAALKHILDGPDLGIVIGYAGTGKSAMLGVANHAWKQAGYIVTGAALSGIAAENLESGSGIASRTLASLEHAWSQGRDQLTSRDVLVIDEAGMIGTRQMERVITEAEGRGAKVVLIGDPEQLQAIEAGAAFRATAERQGSVEITEVRRQREEWQRDATRHLATGRTAEAITAYAEHDAVHVAATREQARTELIDRWDRERQASPGASRIILTHTNAEVRELNSAARERLRKSGTLGDEVTITTERGERAFAPGDRIMFLKNERSLSVKNGSIGTVQSVATTRMAVMLDDGRAVAFDIKDYAAVDHGYAATIHKTQGVTVDCAHILATPGLDRHAAYVALSRHREGVDLHYGSDDFADRGKLVRALSRDRAKDMASDYAREVAERREIIQLPDPPVAKRGMFDGLKLNAAPLADMPSSAKDLDTAVRRYAIAFGQVDRAEREGREPLPHVLTAFDKARDQLDSIRPEASKDLSLALIRHPELIDEANKGRTTTIIRAMMIEAELRVDPQMRADRFVEDWRKLNRYRRSLEEAGDDAGMRRVGQQLVGMAKSLERDPQVESLLRNRVRDLGISGSSGMSVSHNLQDHLGLSRSRGIQF